MEFSKNNRIKMSSILICWPMVCNGLCWGSRCMASFWTKLSSDKVIQRVNLAKYLSGFYQLVRVKGGGRGDFNNKVESHTPFLNKKSF